MRKPARKNSYRIAVVLNRKAGTLRGLDAGKTAQQIREILEFAGHEVSMNLTDGPGIGAIINRHLKADDVDIVVVGGGDGTVSTTSAQLHGSKLVMGIIPLGTMNLYARSLGLPLDPAEAAGALAKAKPKEVDAGFVGKRLFLHQVSFGLHPELVKNREKLTYRSRAGKIMASARALMRTLRRPKLLTFRVKIDGETKTFKTPALVISNNLYGKNHLPYASKVDQGVLGLYVCTSRKWADLVKLTADVMLGSWADNPCVEHYAASEITMELAGRRRPVTASIDGELVPLKGKIDVKTAPGALKVLVPPKPRNKVNGGKP